MNKKVFNIGSRGIKNDIVLNNPQIQPKHARIVIQKDGLQYIEERSQIAQVRVNGVRVKRKVIRPRDHIKLANVPFSIHRYFKIEDEIIQSLRVPNDFSEEFEELRSIYSDYIKAKETIEKSTKRIDMLFDLLLAVPFVGVLLRNIARSVSGSKTRITRMEKIQDLRYEFFKVYRCPNPDCRRQLGEVPWHTLANQELCESCYAIWKKN
ncbi:FHA domain-containing protein [Phaeodactylibacter xiamenensis]|uniref:FHA domain-containing protein n=1 Tax=Phaeodactylibacter xiamenensis TaxID=1524460 RepID=UPI0024A85226|nr:FHA domain-containing protein [Phaeodactylibacter xiamenensis]